MSGLVFGIDIIKGSVRSGSARPHYAVVRAESGKIISEEKNVTLYKLLSYLNREKPELLALDSIQEIAKDTKELYEFLANLPSETKLVQVTGDGVKMETLPRVAARYNIQIDKTNPMDEAKASALIASLGGGFEVIAYEEITDITVSRHRSLGRGGWSQNRYIRKIHGSVKNRSREIEERLKEANLSYDLSVRRAFGGDSRSAFTVQASRRLVPVSSSKGGDTQVKVSGRKKDRIEFTPLTKKSKYLFVGIDPGTTLGVAALDLHGEVLYLKSTRLFSASDLIIELTKIGKPILIASDKAEMPFGVEKIRRAFSAVSWTPKKDILIREKYQLAEGHEFKNDHERDALSAALYAYKSYKNKFDGILKRAPAGVDTEELLAKIVQGLSLQEALAEISTRNFPEKISAEQVISEPVIFDERDEKIARQEEMIRKLRTLAGELSEEISQKDKTISSLNRRLALERDETLTEVLASSEIAERDKELALTKKALRKEERRCKNLRTKLERMKHYVALQAGEGCSALKVLQQLSKDAIRSLDDEMGVGSEDLLYLLKIDGWGKSVVKELFEADIKAVILPKLVYEKAGEQHLLDEFREANLPLLSGAKLSPRVRGKIGVLDTAALDAALLEWESSQSLYLKRKKAGEIDVMVKEYHVERVHEVLVQGIDPDTVIPERFKPPKVTLQKPAEPKPSRPPKPKSIQKTFMKDEPEVKDKEPVKTSDVLTSVLTEYKKERKKEITGEDNG